MLGATKAQELGCNAGDNACLCKNVNFGYGIRDCSNAVCTASSDVAAATSYGSSFCASATGGAGAGAGGSKCHYPSSTKTRTDGFFLDGVTTTTDTTLTTVATGTTTTTAVTGTGTGGVRDFSDKDWNMADLGIGWRWWKWWLFCYHDLCYRHR
jgi:hypothetical protein